MEGDEREIIGVNISKEFPKAMKFIKWLVRGSLIVILSGGVYSIIKLDRFENHEGPVGPNDGKGYNNIEVSDKELVDTTKTDAFNKRLQQSIE